MTTNSENFKAWIESGGEVEFDLHAQNIHDWEWLTRYIPGIVISSAGGLVPFEAYGLIHGYPFYFRARHNIARLNVAGFDGNPVSSREVLYTASVECDSWHARENFIPLLMKLVPCLDVAPFLWKFECFKVQWAEDGRRGYTVTREKDYQIGWGSTPEEGFASAQKPSEYLLSVGWSEEFQKQLWEDQQVSSSPSNTDDRAFPERKPDFKVIL